MQDPHDVSLRSLLRLNGYTILSQDENIRCVYMQVRREAVAAGWPLAFGCWLFWTGCDGVMGSTRQPAS